MNELNAEFDGYCVVSRDGYLTSDGNEQDFIFRLRRDAAASLTEEDIADGYHVVRCKVVPR